MHIHLQAWHLAPQDCHLSPVSQCEAHLCCGHETLEDNRPTPMAHDTHGASSLLQRIQMTLGIHSLPWQMVLDTPLRRSRPCQPSTNTLTGKLLCEAVTKSPVRCSTYSCSKQACAHTTCSTHLFTQQLETCMI
jgi:hypothetical protein